VIVRKAEDVSDTLSKRTDYALDGNNESAQIRRQE